MQRITIDPITRLEGHGKIEIFLDEQGNVANSYFQIPELRGFERFCVGRQVEEIPILTNRICGVCPEAHHMAGAKAVDAVYHVDPPRTAKMLRELLYSAFYVTDHTTHFYALAGPDFVMGPDAPVAERNILGVIHKVGLEIGGKVIQARKYGHTVVEMIGGRKVHPCTSIPGGLTKGINEEQNELYGVPYLGVLKADVDNLGTIFQKGIPNANISRIVSLSRLLNNFFSNYVAKLLKNEFQDIYMVFSVGDD